MPAWLTTFEVKNPGRYRWRPPLGLVQPAVHRAEGEREVPDLAVLGRMLGVGEEWHHPADSRTRKARSAQWID